MPASKEITSNSDRPDIPGGLTMASLNCVALPKPELPDNDIAVAGKVPAGVARHAAPGRNLPGVWLHAAAGGLFVLAGAAAAVSFTAVPAGLRGPAPGGGGRARGSHPRCRRPGVRLPGRGTGTARPPGSQGTAAERGLGRGERVHEPDRGRTRLARPGGLDDAARCLRAGQPVETSGGLIYRCGLL